MQPPPRALLAIAIWLMPIAGCMVPEDRAYEPLTQVSEREVVALLDLAERLSLQTVSDDSLGIYRLSGAGHRVSLFAGSVLVTVDGSGYDLPFAPYLAASDLMVPFALLSFLEEKLQAPPRPVVLVQAATPSSRTVRLPRGWDVAADRTWRYVVIHHSATTVGNADRFDKEHRKKWPHGLGYHFVIGNGTESGDGEIEVGPRWWKQNEGIHGAHAGSDTYNRQGIGICLVGNLDAGAPSAKQLQALQILVEALSRRYGIPRWNVRRHSDVRPGGTHCPGAHFPFATFVRSLRL